MLNASPEVELGSWLPRQSCAQSRKVSDSLNIRRCYGTATPTTTTARAARRDVNPLARGSPGSNLGARHEGRHDLPSDLLRNRNWLGRASIPGPDAPRCDITRTNARFISSGDNWICECRNGELWITINSVKKLGCRVYFRAKKVESFYIEAASY